MKNSSDTIGNRIRDLPVCSAVPQPLRHSVTSSTLGAKKSKATTCYCINLELFEGLGRLAGIAVRVSNPGGVELFRTRSDRPWGPPCLLYNVHRVFPAGKAAGAWC
jgi:hypothetical protein